MKSNQSNHRAERRFLPSTMIRPRLRSGLVLVVFAMLVAANAWASDKTKDPKRSFKTMTVNLYVGGDLGRVTQLDTADPQYLPDLVSTVTGVYLEILASQPETRLQGVADGIVERMPEIVAVQEASLLRVQSPGDIVLGGQSPATNVVFDYLEILVNELTARGASYGVASMAEELDVELPMANLDTGGFDDVRLTDREAILVRTDLSQKQLHVKKPKHGNFAHAIELPELGLSIKRGWCSLDVFDQGEVFRFVCTHLEEETAPEIQLLQARELVCGPAKCSMPVILAGDFNADPLQRDGSPVYQFFVAKDFGDAWAQAHPEDLAGGLTWGHDEFLADSTRTFDRRIDLVLFHAHRLIPLSAEVAVLALSETDAPLWASDHAAVAVEMQVKRKKMDLFNY